MVALVWRQLLSDLEHGANTTVAVLAAAAALWAAVGRRMLAKARRRRVEEIEHVLGAHLRPIIEGQARLRRSHSWIRRELRSVRRDLDEHRRATETATEVNDAQPA